MAAIYLFVLAILVINSDSQKYPTWPSPYSWNGTFTMHDPVNVAGTFKMCYDYKNMKFSKAFTGTSNSSDIFTYSLIFINNTEYDICFGPQNCFGGGQPNTCTKKVHPTFPYPENQFENYTNVGAEVVHTDRNVYHWVGLTPFGFDSDQYFYADNGKYTGYPAGNIMIAEPGWTTEVRWFDQFTSGVNDDCFKLISACNA